MDSTAIADLFAVPVVGPIVALSFAGWLMSREWAKGRAQDVEGEQKRREKAEAERDTIREQAEETRRRLESKIEEVRVQLETDNESTRQKLVRARRLLIDYEATREELEELS